MTDTKEAITAHASDRPFNSLLQERYHNTYIVIKCQALAFDSVQSSSVDFTDCDVIIVADCFNKAFFLRRDRHTDTAAAFKIRYFSFYLRFQITHAKAAEIYPKKTPSKTVIIPPQIPAQRRPRCSPSNLRRLTNP